MEERAEVTQLLAKMFSDRNSALASQNAPLWICFLGRYIHTYVIMYICVSMYICMVCVHINMLCRFEDISTDIRKECIKYSKHFLVYHPEQVQTITGLTCSTEHWEIIFVCILIRENKTERA